MAASSVTRRKESPPNLEEDDGKTKCCGFTVKGKSDKKSRKPPGNKWLQQQIPACRPVFTAKYVFAVFLIIGLIFVGLGILFLIVSLRLHEIEVPYTDCKPLNGVNETCYNGNGSLFFNVSAYDTCEEYVTSISVLNRTERLGCPLCRCEETFTLPFDLNPPWYVYYMMRNYFQNHRRYLNSWDTGQLRGDFGGASSDCRPFVRDNSLDRSRVYAPCGLIANSLFNDSIGSFSKGGSTPLECCDRSDIAWSSDRNVRFNADTNYTEALRDTVMPPYWLQPLNELNDTSGLGLGNQGLIVWFRVSAFPVFRKLYGQLSVDGVSGGKLSQGNYTVEILYNYPVGVFGGRKSIVLAEVSWLGGRNHFLGIAYIVTGVLAIIVGTALLLVHIFCSKWKLKNSQFLDRAY